MRSIPKTDIVLNFFASTLPLDEIDGYELQLLSSTPTD